MANERLQGEEQFRSKSYLLEMPPSHAKIRLESAPEKLNFGMAKLYQKVIDQIVATNAFARSCTVTHSDVASFFNEKDIFCKTNHTFLARAVEEQAKLNPDSQRTFKIKVRSTQTIFEILPMSAVICD